MNLCCSFHKARDTCLMVVGCSEPSLLLQLGPHVSHGDGPCVTDSSSAAATLWCVYCGSSYWNGDESSTSVDLTTSVFFFYFSHTICSFSAVWWSAITPVPSSQQRHKTVSVIITLVNVQLLCGRCSPCACDLSGGIRPFFPPRLHLFVGMSVIIIISQQSAQVRSLSKFAQSLIGSYKYPLMQRLLSLSLERPVETGWPVRSCPALWWRRGNLRLILQRADSALNLDGHGLIRLTLTNLKQMGVSQISSVTG